MKTMFKIAAGLVLGVTVLIVGCAALVGAGADQAAKAQDKTAASAAQVARVHNGMSRHAVHLALAPAKADIVSSTNDALGHSVLEDYNVKDGGRLFGKSVTISYSNGRVIDVTSTDLGGN